jgi:hypothetical protein
MFLPAVSLGSDLILHAIGALRCHVTCKPWSGGCDELNWRSSRSRQQDVLRVFIDVVIVTKPEEGPDIRRRDLFVLGELVRYTRDCSVNLPYTIGDDSSCGLRPF